MDKYLWCLQRQSPFTTSFKAKADLWDCPKFREIVTAFRDFYDLGSFTFKQIDKFLWSEGAVFADN